MSKYDYGYKGEFLCVLKEFNELFFNGREPKIGDQLYVPTLRGHKTVLVQHTEGGKLFIEAAETKKFEDIVIVEVKDVPKKYYIIPSFEFLVDEFMGRGYTLELRKGSKSIMKDGVETLCSATSLRKVDMMGALIKDEKTKRATQ